MKKFLIALPSVLPGRSLSLSRQFAVAGLASAALISLAAPVFAADGAVQAIHFDPSSRHFRIDATGSVKALVTPLNIAGRKRIIIDLDNAEIGQSLPRDVQLLQDLSSQLPELKNVTVNQYGGNGRPIVRILLDLQGNPGNVRLLQSQGAHIEVELSPEAVATRPDLELPPSLQSLNHSSGSPAPVPTNVSAALEDLQNSQAELNRKYDNLSRENQSLKARLNQQPPNDANRKALADKQQEVDRLKAEQAALKTSQDSLRQELAKAQQGQKIQAVIPKTQPPTTLHAESDALRRNLSALNQKYEALSKENQALKARLTPQPPVTSKGSDDQAESLYQKDLELDRLKAEKEGLKRQLQKAQQEAQAKNDAPVAGTTAGSGAADADLQNMRRQLTVAQQSLNDSIRTINEQNKEIAYLHNQVADVKAGLDVSGKEQIARMQTGLDEKDATIRGLQRQLSQKTSVGSATGASSTGNTAGNAALLKRQLDKMTQQYQTDVQDLTSQLKARNSELEQSKTQADKANALQNQVDSLQAQLAASNQKLQDGKGSLVALTEVQKRDAQITTLKNELAQTKAAHTTGGQVVQKNAEALKTARAEREALQKELTEARDQLDSLKASSANSGKASASVKEAMDRLTQENRSLQSTVNSLKSAAQQKGGNSAASGNLQKQVGDLSRQVASLKAENNGLRENLSRNGSQAATSNNPEAERDFQEGKAAMIAKETARALDKLKEAQLLEPDNSRYAVEYSATLADDRQYAEAIDVLRRFLQRNPADREAYNQLGKVYLLNDQADAASQAFGRAISVNTLNNYATSLKKMNQMEDAEQVFRLALGLNPKDSEVLFNLGNLYNAQNKLEQARNKYLEALQIRPDFPEAHYNLGLIFSKLGDNPKAVTHLEKFLELSPNAKNADTIKAYVQKLKA